MGPFGRAARVRHRSAPETLSADDFVIFGVLAAVGLATVIMLMVLGTEVPL